MLFSSSCVITCSKHKCGQSLLLTTLSPLFCGDIVITSSCVDVSRVSFCLANDSCLPLYIGLGELSLRFFVKRNNIFSQLCIGDTRSMLLLLRDVMLFCVFDCFVLLFKLG